MFWGIIHRMIVIDMIKVFAISLIALTSLILMAGVVSEAMRHGLGPVQILAIIPMMLPSLLPYTVPTTTLFTTCIVYGRLSAHNEILALKASGVHIAHVVWPAVSSAACHERHDLCPLFGRHSVHRLPAHHVNLILRVVTLSFAGRQLKNSKINFEIVVSRVQGRKLIDAKFMPFRGRADRPHRSPKKRNARGDHSQQNLGRHAVLQHP